MGLLKGDVDVFGLGTLLQTLAMNGREGVLTLHRGLDSKSIYFDGHHIRLLSTTGERTNRLGRILVREGRLTGDELKSMLEDQKRTHRRIGEIARASGKATTTDIERALHEQVEDETFDLFLWEGAAFEFVEGPPRGKTDTPLGQVTFDTNIAHLALEASRRADELHHIRSVVRDGMVLARTPKPLPVRRSATDRLASAILPAINGQRTVGDIVQRCLYPPTQTLHALHTLLTLGCVREVLPAAGPGALQAQCR